MNSDESTAQFREMLDRVEKAINHRNGLPVLCDSIYGFWEYFKGDPERKRWLKEHGYNYSVTKEGWKVFRTRLEYKPELRKAVEADELSSSIRSSNKK